MNIKKLKIIIEEQIVEKNQDLIDNGNESERTAIRCQADIDTLEWVLSKLDE